MRFRALGRWAVASLVLLFASCIGAQQPSVPGGRGQDAPNPQLPVIHVDNGPNSAAAQKAHYVVLVSLDGFRRDYAKRDGATHLLALGKRGVWAPEGLDTSQVAVAA